MIYYLLLIFVLVCNMQQKNILYYVKLKKFNLKGGIFIVG